MNTTVSTNQRLVTILLALLIILVILLIIGITGFFAMTRGGMMMDSGMMGMNGQTMNDMMAACTNMMQNVQSP